MFTLNIAEINNSVIALKVFNNYYFGIIIKLNYKSNAHFKSIYFLNFISLIFNCRKKIFKQYY